MNIIIFTGPTLAPDAARQVLEAEYRAPASQGDVYRAACTRPAVIGIIDGLFETVPSIWHKEILWAMQQGIHVFGSASMGALRAAELAAFGMEGVGRIVEAYRAGTLEDDDEVAVAHGDAEAGYRPLSIAMVNMRATLAAAETQQIITPPTCRALIEIAKALFYPDRIYPTLLRVAATRGLPPPELEALRQWLPQGQIDQKRADARAMLAAIRARLAAGLAPKEVHYIFEETVFWQHLRESIGAIGSATAAGSPARRAWQPHTAPLP